MKATTATLLLTLPLLPVTATAAATSEKADDSGRIITPSEGEVHALHKADKLLAAHDRNKNGQIDSPEAPAYLAAYNKKLAASRQDYQDVFAGNARDAGLQPEAPLPVAKYEELAGIAKKKENTTSEHFRLRATLDDFSQEVDAKNPVSKLKPALFSFTRDYHNDADAWAAKGAVGGYWESGTRHWSAGAEFERMATDIPGKADADMLAFKILGGSTTTKVSAPLAAVLWDVGAAYTTNFDFDGALLGASLQVEPAFDHPLWTGIWSLGGVQDGISAGNGPALALRNFLRLEGGGTVEDFPNQPGADDEYLRAGAQAEAAFWPFGTSRRLKFTGSYGYYAELLGDGPDYKNFSGGAEWRLDEQGHFVLKATYDNGRVPMLLTDRETLLLSLGVRF